MYVSIHDVFIITNRYHVYSVLSYWYDDGCLHALVVYKHVWSIFCTHKVEINFKSIELQDYVMCII
jgi:hypothetical protein